MFAKRVVVGARRLMVLGVVLGQRDGALVEAALASAQRLGNSAAAALRVQTVLPAGTEVLSAVNANGRRTSAVTAAAVREVGWPGASFRVEVLTRASLTRLRAGERAASVIVRGMNVTRMNALATRSLGGPSLGWRLRHLL